MSTICQTAVQNLLQLIELQPVVAALNNERSKTQIKPKAIFLMGPTASGKTALAIAPRQKLPVDLY